MAVETSTTTVRVKVGETYRFTASVRNAGAKTPFDLTGYTVTMSIKDALTAGTEIFDVSSGSGITIDTPSNGSIAVVFSAAQTALFTAGQDYYTDMRMASASDVMFSGVIKIIAEATVTSA